MVAMNVWPTDAADGSVANEARWRKMARTWAPSGVVAGQGADMAPTLAFPNLTVQAGAAWVDGHYCELGGAQVLAVTANGLAVVRFDPAANTAELLYRDGVSVPAQNPTGVWEQPIARISGSALIDARGPLVRPVSGDQFIPHAAVAFASSTVGGALSKAALNNVATNDPTTFGPVASNELPILRVGIYMVTVMLNYYAVAAPGPQNVSLVTELWAGGVNAARQVDWVPGQNISVVHVIALNIAAPTTLYVQHQDQAFRSPGIVIGPGSQLSVARLGART